MGQYRYYFDTQTLFRERPRFSLVFAAMSTGLTESFLYTPFEVIKIRMQTQCTHTRKRTSNVACMKAVYRQSGLRGFYRGMLPMAKKEMLGNAAYFVAYESSKTYLTELLYTMQSKHQTSDFDSKDQRFKTYGAIATAGGIAGLVYWLAVFPIDTVKSVMQADTLQNPKYRGVIDCCEKLYREQGVKRFYQGISPTLIRAFPANAITFVAFETSLNFLNQHF